MKRIDTVKLLNGLQMAKVAQENIAENGRGVF